MNILGEDRGVLVVAHKFRHTHPTELLNEGSTLPDVQRRLGHSRLDTTRVCLEVDDEALAAKIDARPGTDEQPEPGAQTILAQLLDRATPEGREALAWAKREVAA